jgi:hypothetical protein
VKSRKGVKRASEFKALDLGAVAMENKLAGLIVDGCLDVGVAELG